MGLLAEVIGPREALLRYSNEKRAHSRIYEELTEEVD